MAAHAKQRPPSGASRWLSCPGSVIIHQLYENAPSEASEKGDLAHDLLENGIRFGIKPDTDDPDMDENILMTLEHIAQTKAKYGKDCQVYAEQQLDIPETGEFGTCDVLYVTPDTIHIADYKNGYVVVDVRRNAQLMCYLLGAIAKHGERPKYRIEVMQPNYNHIEGPFRTYDVDAEDIWRFRKEIEHAMSHEDFRAGKHCKRTYCPHRGACATFIGWAKEHLKDAYYSSEVNAMTDEQLSEALDHADILQGIRDELRKEAIRRMVNMGSKVPGFKLVKAKQDRDFRDEAARDAVRAKCLELGATDDDLFDKKMVSVAGIERFFKKVYKPFGRGKWKEAWAREVQDNIREFSGSLTLERAYDGRTAYRRGDEFDALKSRDIEIHINSTSMPSLPKLV